MPEYEFSLIDILAYRTQIYNSALIREYTGQRKPIFWHIL